MIIIIFLEQLKDGKGKGIKKYEYRIVVNLCCYCYYPNTVVRLEQAKKRFVVRCYAIHYFFSHSIA